MGGLPGFGLDRVLVVRLLYNLVEFQETPGLFKFIELKTHLEDLFQCPVDLVTRNALKEPLRDKILQEAIDAIHKVGNSE
jgi:hypothetical protein